MSRALCECASARACVINQLKSGVLYLRRCLRFPPHRKSRLFPSSSQHVPELSAAYCLPSAIWIPRLFLEFLSRYCFCRLPPTSQQSPLRSDLGARPPPPERTRAALRGNSSSVALKINNGTSRRWRGRGLGRRINGLKARIRSVKTHSGVSSSTLFFLPAPSWNDVKMNCWHRARQSLPALYRNSSLKVL